MYISVISMLHLSFENLYINYLYYMVPAFDCLSWIVMQHESMGPKGGFSYFVFKKLHENKQFSKLLRLGEEFHEELLIFLKEHPDLLWLHELFLHQFFSASDTLHELALSEGEGLLSPPEVEAEVESDHCNLELRLADRKRLLYLSKIALMAGIRLLWSYIDLILSCSSLYISLFASFLKFLTYSFMQHVG